MSVRIMTKAKLDVNVYKKLIIREEEKGKYLVKVTGDKSDDRFVSVSNRLTDGMKKMSDSEKIITIVDSFLENAQINCIEASTCCLGCSGRFIKISGSRELYIQHIDNQELLTQLMNRIRSKYDRDRYNYVINSDIQNSYNIVLNKDISYYNREFISCDDCEYHADFENVCDNCPKCIQFRLMFEKGKIIPFDEKFIQKFIYDKLWEVGLSANIIDMVEDIRLGGGQKVGTAVLGYSIICGKLKIMFNCSTFSREYVFNLCNSIVNRYNSELNERDNSVKKRQLKMEGF